MGLLFEEVDNCRRGWEDRFLEMQEGTEERIKRAYDKIEEKIKQSVRRMEVHSKREEIKKRISIGK